MRVTQKTRCRIVVAGTDRVLATRARVASSLVARMVGLLRDSHLEAGEGLIITTCRSIHTFGMRFAIDAVFVDADWRVVAIWHALPPWRVTSCHWAARCVVELPAGVAQHVRLNVGDRLEVTPVDRAKNSS